MIVLDSSSAVDFLVRRDAGEWVEEQLLLDSDLHAPQLLDVEVANAFRHLVLRGELGVRRAEAALEDLADLDVARHGHVAFLARIWQLRRSVSAYDAAYIALAEALGADLVTTDLRLGRARGIRTRVVTP